MSRSQFEIINSVLDIWRTAIQAIMFLVLWTAVFKEKNGKKDVIAAVLFIFINAAIGFFPGVSRVRYAVLAFAVMGYGWMNYKKQIGKAVFVMLTFYNFHCLSFLIVNSIYMEATNVMMEGLDILQDGYWQQVYRCISVGMAASAFFYTALFAAMTAVFYKIIKGEAVMAWQDVFLLSVLNFVGSMIANVVGGLLSVRAGGDVFALFDEKPDLLWKAPMIALCIFAGETALIYFWQRYRVLLSEKQKHFVEEQQVKAMKKRLEEAENFYGSIRKVRHEMKNHMANIKGLAEAGAYGEIEEYVRRMDETMQKLEYKYVTGNAVTDVIINDKCQRAEKAGIRFAVDFQYGGEIPVFDMGIILNNLLDNAIEACEKLEEGKRYIRLSLKQKKQFLLLNVENSFDGAVPARKSSSLPVTTKQSILPDVVTAHGIGLENVRDIAERYFGGVSIKVKGDVFHVAVMLQHGEVKEA